MFIIKIFGILDLYSAAVMLLVQHDIVPWRFIIAASAWLIFKGFLFKGEPVSMIDMGIGVYHLIMFFLPIPIVTYILAVYLIFKGLQSLMG